MSNRLNIVHLIRLSFRRQIAWVLIQLDTALVAYVILKATCPFIRHRQDNLRFWSQRQ